MPQNTDPHSTKRRWNPIILFKWIWSTITSWFHSNQELYPSDEAGDLMRRYMSDKSWFEKLSSLWKQNSFLLKFVYIFILTIVGYFLGLLINIPVILACCIALVSIITHKLLIAHENNRWKKAQIFAAESIELNNQLSESQAFLNTAMNEVNSSYAQLTNEGDALQEQVTQLTLEANNLHQQNAKLNVVVDSVEKETTLFTKQVTKVTETFSEISTDLDQYQQIIDQSKEALTKIDISTSELSEVVAATKKTQNILAEVVDTISLFADKSPQVSKQLIPNNDDFIATLTREVDEMDAFIEQFKGEHPYQYSLFTY